MKTLYRTVSAILIWSLYLPASAAVNAYLNHDQVESGESVQLTLQHDGNTQGQPDLNPLKQDFDILSQSSGSSIQIINGKMSTQSQISLTLAPKHDGKIRIPPLEWGGERSSALDLNVGNGKSNGHQERGQAAPETDKHVFLTSTVDQKQPYIQAAVTLTVKLYTDRPLYQVSLDLPASSDIVVQAFGKDQQNSEILNGHRYQTIERKYLLFPQRSGQLNLPGPVLNAAVPDTRNADPMDAFDHLFRNPLGGMINAARPLRLRGDAIALNVRPRPSNSTGDWLPAQNVTLEESWHPDNKPVHVGEPITRQLKLSAVGLTAAQLPDISTLMPIPHDVKVYPDQPKLDYSLQNNSIVGIREQNIALIANRAGHYRLPAIHLYWWDTTQNSQREIVLPAHTLDILPAAGDANDMAAAPAPQKPSAPPSPPPQSPSTHPADITTTTTALPWPWISLGLGILWLSTLTAWRYGYKRSAYKPSSQQRSDPITPVERSASEARKSFQKACQDNSPQQARLSLLAWVRATWPQNPPAGLNALAQRLGDPQLTVLLRELDRACYTTLNWKGEPLARLLTKLPSEPNSPQNHSELGKLYP